LVGGITGARDVVYAEQVAGEEPRSRHPRGDRRESGRGPLACVTNRTWSRWSEPARFEKGKLVERSRGVPSKEIDEVAV
jgi:hypothetical protein